MMSKSVTYFLDFRLSLGSIASYFRGVGNLRDVYIENFVMNQLVKEFENRSIFATVINKHQVVYFLRHIADLDHVTARTCRPGSRTGRC